MKRSIFLIFLMVTATALIIGSSLKSPITVAAQSSSKYEGYIGSTSCRECHEKFYKLWAPSHHGLAMQHYTRELARKSLTPQTDDIVMGDYRYRAEIQPGRGWVLERGPKGEKKYPMVHVLGGKNVYYFLTPMERGRLQTLPVAYDVRGKEWFDTAASGVRHFPGQSDGGPVNWKDPAYTFNTACYRCHVSQLSTNYDLKTDTYSTVWAEPGINCESCHGPGEEHIRVCRAAPQGKIPEDLKIIRGGRDFTVQQNNETCAPCHAKMRPLTTAFKPGDRFFDHYDLTTLEDPDFYPDGRDLGENYTYTTWLMSPCAKSGQLSCLHCHTSSGRFRQKNDPNTACTPCHQKRVEDASTHTRHKTGSKGNQCISCHMPMTEFARMRRSDHSMLPPTPAATIAFQSPNGCNLCHRDKDAAWADQWVRKWRTRDYQAPVLHRAGLVEAARKRDWEKLPEMLEYITNKDRDEVYAASLIRLLGACEDPIKWPAILKAAKDPSPLIRGTAVELMRAMPSKETGEVLLGATGDDYRLVRVRAAASLASYPRLLARILEKDQDLKNLHNATQEFLTSLLSRPDQWTSYYNLGNYYMERGDISAALAAYRTSLTLEPRAVMAMVNTSMAYARAGENARAGEFLKKALQIEPLNAAANFNMGLLRAEQRDVSGAEKHLRAALKADPKMHQAAYNLCVLLANEHPKKAIELCMKAFELNPNPKYAYTIAFYMRQNGDEKGASNMLRLIIEQWPAYADAYLQLGDIYEKTGRKKDAEALYIKALKNKGVSRQDSLRLDAKLRALSPEASDKVNKK
ncbi:MAG: tetratricopeptide repeat protein [Desulfobacterales bacterium]|nr:tetratricopeptide repeat protein [Desulfobacterales bacterium]MBL7101810.1 tetratricopeptide repeat protein [Desulfobacteraceae bacterium]